MMRLAQKYMKRQGPDTFVSSDHGFAPQFRRSTRVRCWWTWACSRSRRRQLPARRPARRSARRRPAGRAAPRRSTSTSRGATRPAAAFQQVPANQEATEVARIKAAFLALEDSNDWTGDGQPEGWKVIDRMFTKAEARYIPNGAGGTADMAHPTRTGDLIAFSYPPYQFDASTPGTLIARSAFFGQHGYVPDVQDLRQQHEHAGDVPRRRPGDRWGRRAQRAQHRPRADRGIPARHPRAAEQPGRVRRGILDDGDDFRAVNIVGLNDFHGQLDPAATTLDTNTAVPVGGAAQLATMFDEEAARAARPVAAAGGGRQRRRVAAELGAAAGPAGDRRGERVGARRDELRQPRVRLRDRRGSCSTRSGRTSRSWRPTSSRRRPAVSRTG